MARETAQSYETIQKKALNRPLFFVVDMINGFAKKGALADPAISDLAEPIEALIQKENKEDVIFLCDSHEKKAREFSAFPKHCLKGSEESEVIDELQPYVNRRIEKNSINSFFAPGFQELIEELPDRDLVVMGCCTDLCVLQLALSLQSWLSQNNLDGRVIVPVNCVDTYDAPAHPAGKNNQAALDNMAANGVFVVDQIEG